MKQYRILFLLGKDRPGIVDEVSSILFEGGANLEDSRMAAMGGCFSFMALFSCDRNQIDIIESGLAELEEKGFALSLHEAEDPAATPAQPELPMKFEVMAMDHPGIVNRVVRVLHNHNVNIEAINTQVIRAPYSGAPIFNMHLEAGVPPDTSVAKVKNDLMELATAMNLDLNFQI